MKRTGKRNFHTGAGARRAACAAIALLFVLALLPAGAKAEATTVGTWTSGATTCTLTDDGVFTVSGTGKMADYGSDGAPWAANESLRNRIGSVVIEDGVTQIGSCAFLGCANLTSVAIPDSVANIRYCAFLSSGLTSVTIPIATTVVDIGQEAFEGCAALTEIVLQFRRGGGIAQLDYNVFRGAGTTRATIKDPAGYHGGYFSLEEGDRGYAIENGSTLTVTLDDNNTLGRKGQAVSASDISVGDILTLEYDDSDKLTGIKVMKTQDEKTRPENSKKEKSSQKTKKSNTTQTTTA